MRVEFVVMDHAAEEIFRVYLAEEIGGGLRKLIGFDRVERVGRIAVAQPFGADDRQEIYGSDRFGSGRFGDAQIFHPSARFGGEKVLAIGADSLGETAREGHGLP